MFREMRYVLAVYHEKGFSRAARKLYVSQPSLSAMIRKAEERIGSPIFDRSTTPVTLTQVGREYVRMAQEIAKAEEEFSRYISDVNHCLTGALSLGGTTLFTSFILPPLMTAFSERHPAVEIRLHETHTAQLYRELNDGELDLIVENTSPDTDYFAEKPIMNERMLLAMPDQQVNAALAAYRLSPREVCEGRHMDPDFPCAPLELAAECDFLLLKEGNDTRRRADRLLESAGVKPHVRLLLDQQITAYNLACAGMGTAFVSDTLVTHVPEARGLSLFKLDPEHSRRRVSFFFKRNRSLSSAAQAFMDIVSEAAGQGMFTRG